MKHINDMQAALPNLNVTTADKMTVHTVTAIEAAVIQGRFDKMDSATLEWCIHDSPKDYPGKFVAKPWVIPVDNSHRQSSGMIGAFLVADTLDELRAMLPEGLSSRVPPGIVDPTVVEVWRREKSEDGDHRAAVIIAVIGER